MKKNKTYLPVSQNILLVFIGVVFALLLAEISFRIFDLVCDIKKGRRMARISSNPDIGYELKPNFQKGRIKINSYGFRGKEFSLKKDESITRIVALGDSITFAPNVNIEDCYLSLLEKRLNNNDAPNSRFEVINAGIGGYDVWQYLAVYEEKVRRLSADIIIVAICQNDFIKLGPYYKDFFGIVRGDFADEKYKSFLDYSLLYRKISFKIKGLAQRRYKRHKGAKAPFAHLTIDTNWAKGITPLKKLLTAIKKDRVDFVFLIFPLKNQIKGEDQHSSEKFTNFAKDYNVPMLDLLHTLKNIDEDIYVKNDYIHFNESGHKLIADAVYEFIIGL